MIISDANSDWLAISASFMTKLRPDLWEDSFAASEELVGWMKRMSENQSIEFIGTGCFMLIRSRGHNVTEFQLVLQVVDYISYDDGCEDLFDWTKSLTM